MDILKKNTRFVEETTLGIYVWEMPDGRWIGDDDGNFLSITSIKGNKSKIDALAREVGFSSRQHLNKPFKKFHGGNPSDLIESAISID